MTTQHLLTYLNIFILLISVFSVSSYLEAGTGLPFMNTLFWWCVQLFSLLLFLVLKKFNYKSGFFSNEDSKVIRWFIIWNLICILRGLFIANSYWDWKALVGNSLGLLIPLIAYSSFNLNFVQSIFKGYIKYTLPIFPLILFFIPKDSYGFYLVPISILLFFVPFLSRKWKYLFLFLAGFVVFSDLGARSNAIRFTLPLLFLIIYYFRNRISCTLIELLRKLFLILPLFFFFLALTGSFNIFNMNEYLGEQVLSNQKDDLVVDTRSFLYEEVLETAIKEDSWWFGRSPARGNETNWFAEEIAEVTGKNERYVNEVAILNIFNWTGTLGVILYFLVFYRASYLAVKRSNNFLSRILGLFVAFRWSYAWVEDVNNFTLNYLFLWILIGLCLSGSFRELTNEELKIWVQGIFDKRFRNIYN